MLFTSFHNNPVNILHFPGKQKIKMADKLNTFKELPVSLPENISIISIMTPDIIKISPLHYQLTKSNIPYINTVPKNHKVWINKDKPTYIIKALEQVKTDFCLILDGNDVVIIDDLSNIIYKFEGYERDIIYNATANRFPNIPVESIEGLNDFTERPLLFGPFCFLNAGCCIGKTKTLIEFYKEVKEDCDISNIPSEQYHVRKIMNKHQDKVFIDYDCRIFQAFNKGMTIEDPNKDDEEENNFLNNVKIINDTLNSNQ